MASARPGSAVPARRRAAPVARFTTALVTGDAEQANAVAAGYLDATRSRLTVVSDLFHPAQYLIGDMWYQGRLGVAEEHRATAIIGRLAMALPPTPAANPVRQGARCLLAGIAGERHVLGLQLLALVLEDEGWLVDQLLPPTPSRELLRAVSEWRPDVIGLSAAYLSSTRQITAAVAQLKQRHIPVMVGGSLFNRAPDLWRAVGADAHGSDARVSAVLMRRYLR